MSEWVKLRRLARLSYGDALPTEKRVLGEHPVIGSGGVIGTHNIRNVLSPGVIVGRKGSYGSVHWAPNGCFAIDTAYFIDQRSSSVDLRWLYYALLSVDIKGVSQDVGVPGLSREAAHGVSIPAAPPPEEQRRIAEFLDCEVARIDKVIGFRGWQIKLLKSREQALRDIEIEEIFKRFGSVALRRLAVRIEQGVSPQCEDTPAEEYEWGVLKLSSIKCGIFDSRENKRIPEGVIPAVRYEVRAGDLLVTRANTPDLVGDVAVVDGNQSGRVLPDLIYRVSLASSVSPNFISEVALSSRVRGLVQATARGSSQSMVKIRGEDIKSWPVPNADSRSQERIVEIIREFTRDFRRMNSLLNAQMSLLAERRQALITAAVTGQIDVTTARGADVA